MVGLVDTFRASGIAGYVQLLVLVGGILWAAVCAALLALRWKVPPVVAAAPLGLVPLVATVGAWAAASSVDAAVAAVDPAQRGELLAMGTSELAAGGVLGLVAVPVAWLLGLGGLAAGVRAPRAWAMPAAVALLLGVAALLPALGLVWGADPAWTIGRVLLYGVTVIPVALSAANAHPGSNGPEGGTTTALAHATVVAAGELAWVSAASMDGLRALAMTDTAQWPTLLAAVAEELGAYTHLAWAAFLLASVPAVLAVLRSGPTLTDEEILAGHAGAAPGRSAGRLFALGVLALWAVAFLALDATSALATLAASPR